MEGKTVAEHDNVMYEVLSLLATGQEELLPRHQALLDLDLEKLGNGSTADRQYWVANMTSAISAARTTRLAEHREPMPQLSPDSRVVHNVPGSGS